MCHHLEITEATQGPSGNGSSGHDPVGVLGHHGQVDRHPCAFADVADQRVEPRGLFGVVFGGVQIAEFLAA